MFKRLFVLASFVLMLGSVSSAADVQWTGLGADHLWSTPANWSLGTVPMSADEVRIDVPAAAAPNGPVIQDGIAAQAKGIFTEAAGEPTLTMTGGTLVVADWIWWGDGANSFAIWTMSGGTVTVTNEFELGWGGGAGTLIMTGGTVNAGEAVIPTGSGAFGKLFLNGGTYNVTKPDGLKVNDRGQIDITAGTLVVEGDETAKVNDLITAGRITAHGGSGKLKVDYNQSNAGKTTVTAVQKVVVLSEDFEGLPLGPNVDEALAGAQVWTDTPPEGWTIDESGVPGIGDPATDGVTEWAGWAFANKDWWVQTAGDQRRSEFTLGQGTVAVADPDEWDDKDHPKPNSANPYDTWLSTPAVDISGVEAGSLQLKFDSSWRPEYDDNYHQTANITVSFDGAAPVEVLRWESNEASPNFKPDTSTNETVVINLGNPTAAKSMVVTFGLFDAGNDWWWAIDNVEVTGNPLPEPIDPSQVIYYSFDSVDGVVADQSGKGHDGAVVGAVTAEAAGKYNGAAKFANAGYLDLNGPGFPAQDIPTSAITLAVWVKCQNTGDHHATLNARASDTTWIIHAEVRSGGNYRWLLRPYKPGATIFDIQAGTVTWDEWTHYTGTYDKASGKAVLYINGEVVKELDVTNPADIAADWGLGARVGYNIDNARPFTGLMDEFRLFTRALSHDEVRYLAGIRSRGAENLVLNPSFEEDEPILDDPAWERWCTWNPAEGAGSKAAIVDTEFFDGARSLRIEPKGVENWHFIVLYLPILVDMNKNYDVSLWAKAEAPRPLTVQLKATDNSISAWGATDFQLTTEWAEYRYVSNVLIDNVKLEILCSATEVPFWLDMVSVSEGK